MDVEYLELIKNQQAIESSPLPQVRNNIKFIAIHLGARDSNHDETSSRESSTIAEKICKTAMSDPKIESSLDAVVRLVKMMEDNPRFNCGNGSNLTIRGEVECDASLMCGKTRSWASVGAVSGCKNPVVLAKNLYDKRNSPIPLGLVPPNFLVGSGANIWMKQECSSLAVHPSKMITAQALSKYQRLKSSYDYAKRFQNSSITGPPSSERSNSVGFNKDNMLVDDELDTVGAVAIDVFGNFASAISSGGLWLKQKGRIGQAAMPGAGCWSENHVAVATTGTGEYISSIMLAKKFHDKLAEAKQNLNDSKQLVNDTLIRITNQCFQELQAWSVSSQIVSERLPVALMAICNAKETMPERDKGTDDDEIILSVAHNTKSLVVIHMHRDQDNPITEISFLKDAEIASKSVILNITQIRGQTISRERQVLSMSQPAR